MFRVWAVFRVPVLSRVGKWIVRRTVAGLSIMDVETVEIPAAGPGVLWKPLYFRKEKRAAPAGVHERRTPDIRVVGASGKESVGLGRHFREPEQGLAQVMGHLEFHHGVYSHFVGASKLGLKA